MRKDTIQRTPTVENLLGLVKVGTGKINNADQFKAVLHLAAAMPNYSVRNLVLIKEQMPGATRLATKDKWESAGRTLMPDATAAYIIAPIYPEVKKSTGSNFCPVALYDVSQTTGAPLQSSMQTRPEVLLQALSMATDIRIEQPTHLYPSGSLKLGENSSHTLFMQDMPDVAKLDLLINTAAWIEGQKRFACADNRNLWAEGISYLIHERFAVPGSETLMDTIASFWTAPTQYKTNDPIAPILIRLRTPKEIEKSLSIICNSARKIIGKAEKELDRIRDEELSVPLSAMGTRIPLDNPTE